MATFTGKRMRRRGLFVLGATLGALGFAAGAVVIFTRPALASRFVPWLFIPAMIAFYGLMVVSMIPRRASLTVEGGAITPSWGRAFTAARVEVARWVLPALDTATGSALVITGQLGERLVVGGQGHDGAGYARAAAVRAVDFAVEARELDQLAAALGVGRVAAGPLVVQLVPSSQTAGGVLRTMGPWLLTIAALSAIGVGLGATGAGERLLTSPQGPAILGIVSLAIAALGIGLTVRRSMRVKPPALELRAIDVGLALARPGAEVIARAAWPEVRAAARRYTVRSRSGSHTMPVLELTVGDHPPLVVASWESPGWAHEVPRQRRAPRWLVGAPEWQQLVAALGAHGRL